MTAKTDTILSKFQKSLEGTVKKELLTLQHLVNEAVEKSAKGVYDPDFIKAVETAFNQAYNMKGTTMTIRFYQSLMRGLHGQQGSEGSGTGINR